MAELRVRCNLCSLFAGFVLITGVTSCSSATNDNQQNSDIADSRQLSTPMTSYVAAAVDGSETSTSSGPDFDIVLRGGMLKVFLVESDGTSVLIRNRPDPRQTLSDKQRAEVRVLESRLAMQWLKSTSRFQNRPPQNPLEEHDALLEVADRLEPLQEKYPEHLGLLRDLLTVYAQLLAFERESDLGSNLCVLASDKLVDFERRAAPLASNDQQLVDRTRAWLHYVMHHYPTAAFSGDTATRNVLRVLDQQHFDTQPSFPIGRLRADVFFTIGKSPDGDLLWDTIHILVGYPNEKNPALQVGYTLCTQGEGERQRWYLMGHALNRSSMIRLFGTQRPEFSTVKSLVTQHTLSLQHDITKQQDKGER